MKAAAYIRVCGVVQGVGYRYFVHRQAKMLGLAGQVRNRFDGDVEVEVEGEKHLIEELVKALHVGPPAAQVTDVQVEWGRARSRYSDFQITF